MILYHVTPVRNLQGILKSGLRPEKSRGKMPVTWLCTKSKVRWAVKHVSKHQNATPGEMVILRVKIPRGQVTRRRRGIWITTSTVQPLNAVLASKGIRP